MGMCGGQANRLEEAIECLSSALEVGAPGADWRVAVLLQRAEVLLRLRRLDPAIADCDAALAIRPSAKVSQQSHVITFLFPPPPCPTDQGATDPLTRVVSAARLSCRHSLGEPPV